MMLNRVSKSIARILTCAVIGLISCLPDFSGLPNVSMFESCVQAEALGLPSGVIATHQANDFASRFLKLTSTEDMLESTDRSDRLKIETREGLNAIAIEVEDLLGVLQEIEDMSPQMVSRMVQRLTGLSITEWTLTEWERTIIDIPDDHTLSHTKIILAAIRDSKIYIAQQEIIGRIHAAYNQAILDLQKAAPFYTLDDDGRQRFIDFLDHEVEVVVRHNAFGDLRRFGPTKMLLQAAHKRIQDHAVRTFVKTLRSA